MPLNGANQVESTDLVYGIRGGRKIIGGLDLEGGFRFSAADRMTVAAFAEEDGTIPEPIWSNVFFLKGGNLFVSDLGFKWNLRQKKFSPFLYAGGGSVTRSQSVSNDTLLLLSILAQQQNRGLIWHDLPANHASYHLDFGGGGEQGCAQSAPPWANM